MFGDLSFSHILILLLVLVLVFGAKRIPEIGSSLGQGIKEFKRSLKEATGDDPSPPRSVRPPRDGRSRCGGPRSSPARAGRRGTAECAPARSVVSASLAADRVASARRPNRRSSGRSPATGRTPSRRR